MCVNHVPRAVFYAKGKMKISANLVKMDIFFKMKFLVLKNAQKDCSETPLQFVRTVLLVVKDVLKPLIIALLVIREKPYFWMIIHV